MVTCDDHNGVEVVGIWKWFDDLNMGMATEIDTEEIFSTLRKVLDVCKTDIFSLKTWFLCLYEKPLAFYRYAYEKGC